MMRWFRKTEADLNQTYEEDTIGEEHDPNAIEELVETKKMEEAVG